MKKVYVTLVLAITTNNSQDQSLEGYGIDLEYTYPCVLQSGSENMKILRQDQSYNLGHQWSL